MRMLLIWPTVLVWMLPSFLSAKGADGDLVESIALVDAPERNFKVIGVICKDTL